jgi:SDR family mycofactocin-dependent oxidoreductase
MGKLDGKVAFITGAARGQGRSHAARLAGEGADIIAVDICDQIKTVNYPMSTPDDLAQTVKEVESLGRRIVARQADVRDRDGLQAAFDDGVAELGGVDIVLANAGILPAITGDEPLEVFTDVVAVNLTGAWNTVEVAKHTLIEQGRGGAIVMTSSSGGLRAYSGDMPGDGYTASKHGIVGVMRAYALKLAPHRIRVNSVHPGGVPTSMVTNEATTALLTAMDELTRDQYEGALPIDSIEPIDISNAILWLVSDEARYVTGVTLPVDAGHLLR